MLDVGQHWRTLKIAQRGLIDAIASQLSSPSFTQIQHLLSCTPNDRPSVRASIQSLDSQISILISQFEEFQVSQEEITVLYLHCKSIKSKLAACITPIDSLPAELIQHIVNFVVESPRHARQITTISHVSRTWRSAVFGMPKLFASPDWLYWPNDFRAEWIARAGQHHLEAWLIETGYTPEATFRLQTGSAALLSLAARLSTLRLHINELHTIPHELMMLFTQPMPNMESIIVLGGRGTRVPIAIWDTPRLHTLYSSHFHFFFDFDSKTEGDPKSVKENELYSLRNIGSLVHHASELEDLLDIGERLKNKFRLTIHASPDDELAESLLKPWKIRPNAWLHLSSLRLHGFNDEDERRFKELVKRFSAPQLRSLELFDMGSQLFVDLAAAMPAETSSHVTTLLIAGFENWERSLKTYIEVLRIDSISSTRCSFPNLVHLIFQDLPGTKPRIPQVDVKQLARCLATRRGILKRLILPSNLDPSNASEPSLDSDPRQSDLEFSRFSTPYSLHPTVRLTVDDERAIREAGDLDELGYTYLISYHGFDLFEPS
ncbi:hypothetical protein DL93DRAFT_1509852 [Clavulina sp. PMI_390]|nr:hypothetical protein DL93DRAFT_1509852 [Clavulina sp. PMI_390]